MLELNAVLMNNELRRLPSVSSLLSEERIKQLEGSYPHQLLVNLIRQRLEDERLLINAGSTRSSTDEIVESIRTRLKELESPGLRPVINATGVVLHTNLGRAPLSPEAITAMSAIARGYCNLEFDLERGTRGSRHTHIERILCQLSGAEAAMVVNNNASAVLLGLTALAKRKEVIVSRGQAVEIGDSFRIPDIMRQSGVRLIEVGTTNCTYTYDYEQAITPKTMALMRVHASNFQITGFTHAVSLAEMVSLGRQHGLPVLDDLGSGCFLETAAFGLGAELTVQQSVADGAGLVFFSGDKLVGGPQAGIIVGEERLVDRLKKHPLARAVRIDKVTLAGLIATLVHYLKGEAAREIPVWRMLSASPGEIDRRARKWAEALGDPGRVITGESMIGGGSLPGSTLPTSLVAVGGALQSAGTVARKLRSGEPPIIGRISEDVLLLDPRSVLPEDDHIVLDALRGLTIT